MHAVCHREMRAGALVQACFRQMAQYTLRSRADSGVRVFGNFGIVMRKPSPERLLLDDNRFRDAILYRAPVRMNEELGKSEAEFQSRGAIAQGALDRVPKAHVTMHQRDYANTHNTFAHGPAVPEPGS